MVAIFQANDDEFLAMMLTKVQAERAGFDVNKCSFLRELQ